MNNDYELTDAERIRFINIVINAKGLIGLLEEMKKEFNLEISKLNGPSSKVGSSNSTDKANDSVSSSTGSVKNTNPNEASIYDEKYRTLALNEQRPPVDFSNREANTENYNNNQSSEGVLVRERKLPNPWADAESVRPGELNL